MVLHVAKYPNKYFLEAFPPLMHLTSNLDLAGYRTTL
jgi:hypothetical protein